MNALRRTAVLLAAALLVPNLVACASAMAKDNTQTNAVSSDSTSFSQRSAVTISTPSLTSCPYDTSVEPKNPQIASTTQVTYAPSPETVDTLPSREQTTVELPLTTPEESTVTTIRIEQSVPETTAPQSATTVPVTGQPEMTEKPKIPEPITFDTPVIDALPNWDKDRTVVHYNDFKAMWISQYDLYGIYTNNGSQREETDYTNRIQQMLDNVQSLGFNTVILQVRPNGDSMYPSEIYPMCQYVVGTYGVEARYDPIDILVKEAHQRSISIHAWINPLRAMTDDEILLIDPSYTIREWHDDPQKNGTYLVLYKGRYYLNPAYKEVRELIISGAKEVLTRYPFDGLHMDDYFYPTTNTSFDADAYNAYVQSGGEMNLGDFRRAQINRLVADLYRVTKSVHPNLRYGISPAGNYDYAYASQYADFYTWCGNDGYIDYICPQIYYGLEHQIYPFGGICEIFSDMITVDSIDLIIGMAFGKAESQTDKWAGTGVNEWKDNKDVMKRSLEYTANLQHCTGIAVFCYQYFYHPVTGVLEDDIAEERNNFLPVLNRITWQTTKE